MSQPPSVFSQGTRNTAPMSVLILEDERFDRHRLARLCSALEFPCLLTNTTSLEHFSSALENEVFGLILLDYKLPDGTGLDALDLIRMDARNLNVPTLMISGMVDGEISDKATSAGCAGFLSKDALTSDTFDVAVKSALGTGRDPTDLTKDRFNQAEMADLLALTTQRNARDIKPMVSRMMRQLRGVRASAMLENNSALHTIEQNCETLWEFLVEMERQDGVELLQTLSTVQSDAPAMLSSAAKPRKPPSPFSRLKH